MANSDKNIRITTSKNKTTYPNIVFTGSAAGSSVITLEVLDDNTLSFTSNEGQVFSIDSNLSTGTIWAVSDISGIPLLSASAGGTIGLGVYGGLVAIGQTNPTYKLDLKGSFGLASSNDSLYNFIFSNSAASGSNSLQIRSANSLLLYNSGNTFYTGFKSNAATNITYTLPTTDGSSGQFLQTNGSAVLSWATATGGGGGSGSTGVNAGGQYQIGYYASTGASIDGSSTFTNNTSTGVIAIGHATVSTNFGNGALTVSGGVGIGGSLYVGGTGSSISGVRIASGAITGGVWNGTVIGTQYGGTGQNLSSSSGVLTISSGTVSASTTSSAISSAISDKTGSGALTFATSPDFTTSVTTGTATFAVFNTTATTINAFGAATAISLGAATGKATLNSTDNSISSTTGGLVVSGGAGFAKSISVAGRLQLLNGANVTAFVSSGTGNTVYTLPATSPATGSSVLQSTSAGVLSWVPLATGSGSVNSGTANFAAYYATSSTAISENANLQFTGTGLSVGGNLSSSSTLTGSLIVRGGLGITGNAFIGSTVTIQDTTVSSSTTTGALVVAGGIGVGGKVFADVLQSGGNTAVGGNLTVAGTVDLGNATADSISFLGRVDTDIDPIASNTYDLGESGLVWKNVSIGSSAIFYNTTNANTLGFRAGVSGASLIYVFPIDTPNAGEVLSASAPSGGVVTLSWEADQTGAPAGGITTLNTLTTATQSFATGTAGNDFAISSATSTHTFNLPDASATARGVVSTGTQTLAGAKTFSSALSVTDATVSTSSSTGALKVTGGVGIGGSLYTSAGSTSSVSGVLLQNGNVSASTYNKLTLTAPATSATLTLADGSSLITSGANSLTLTTTATTNATLPSGTKTLVATDVTSLASLTTASSLNSIGTIATGVWNGTAISSTYGGTGLNNSGQSGILKYTTGTGSLVAAPTGAIVGTTDTQTLTNKTYNSVTITAPASSATLTLANLSSLITSGGHSLTFNTTATTSVTLPTTGTLATTSNKLSDFAATTSLELLNTITGEVGSGALVFATSPDFTTSVATVSTTFGVFNTTATTINAFGAATVMSIGAATGKATFNSTDDSSSTTTGSLAVSGGAGFAKSVSVGGRLQMFNGANFTAFVSSASGNTVYTLPATSPATGSSVLQSTSTGVMSWVPMTAGGGPSGTINSSTVNNIAYYSAATTLSGDSVASGNYFFYNGTNTGLNIAHADNEYNPTASTKLLTVGTGATNYSTYRKALAVISTNNAWTNGDLLVLGVGALGSDVRFGVDWTGRVQIGTPGTGFTLPATNGTSGQVLTANTDGKATWTTVAAGGSGTVNSGTAGSVAFYAANGTAVSGTGLIQVPTSGTAISVFTNLDLRSQNDIRFFNSGNTFNTALQAGSNTVNYTLSLPTAPVGAGFSVIVTGSDGQMYFVAPGSGIAFSAATANTPTIRAERPLNIQFASGFTPLAAGADNVVIRVPESPTDGTTVLTYNLRRFQVRVETPSAGTSRLQLERSSTDTGVFTLAASGSSHIGGFGVTITGAGIYLTSVSTFSGSLVTSGNLLRLNWTLLNATHANFSVNLILEEV